MAVDAFLKIDGIPGDSTDRDHKGEIEILSLSWGETNASSSGKGSGGGAGKVSMQDFHFSMLVSSASPKLMTSCASGKHFKSATLTCRKAGGERAGAEFMKIKLTDILVSSYITDGTSLAETLPMDQISLNFSKIEFLFSAGGEETTADATRG